MELKEYWQVIARRAWIIIGLTLVALVVSWMATTSISATYGATMRLAMKPQTEQRSDQFYSYDEYYAYVASEYLVDDIIEVIESQAFRDELLSSLQGKVTSLPDKAIEGKKAHRILIVNVTAGSREAVQLVSDAIAKALTEPGNTYFANLSSQNPVVTLVDPPRATLVGEGRKYLDVGLRTALGLIAGIGLAFLLEYLDNTIGTARQAEQSTGLPILGEIPRRRRGLLGL